MKIYVYDSPSGLIYSLRLVDSLIAKWGKPNILDQKIDEYEIYNGRWYDTPDGWVPAEDAQPSDTGYDITDGWGYRWSLPGYLDCSDWQVYETDDEMLQGLLREMDTYDGADTN